MYLDTILFILGAVCAAAVIFFVMYLLISRRRSRMYTEVLKQESEKFDAITATLFTTGGVASKRYDSSNKVRTNDGFDPDAIKGIYVIEREISGGAMSRTFQVRSVKLGNPWFMKFIPRQYGGLANEVDILKLLNHASLPRIIDVFHQKEGVYLVETLVEGVPLDAVKKAGVKANQYVLVDWFEQIAQALNYLHCMKPSPIFHLDLKPGNIMVTHDNRLVLVDFGIARRYGEDTPGAITVSYAAPEQFSSRMSEKYAQLVYERFGGVPGGAPGGAGRGITDARTDIYSLGVIMFELATGVLPTMKNLGALKNSVSDELGMIIKKCLAIDPRERYQSAEKLLGDLRAVKGTKIKMAKMLLRRRLAAAAASLSLIISGGTFVGGYYVFAEENAAVLSAKPEIITVSLQQSSDFAVSKRMPDSREIILDSAQITWEFSEDNIARIDGARVSGINEGQTVIRGKYRNKEIDLTVRVVEPMDGSIDVSQRYEQGRYVSLFGGSDGRVRADGSLGGSPAEANFMSPESITAAGGGKVYLSDAGEIRVISGGSVSTLKIPVDYIKASMVRSDGDDLYILSNPWQDGDRYFYALARLSGGGVEALYIADALYTAVEDFGFCGDGRLYFIDRNEGLGGVFLKSLNLYDVNDIQTLTMLPAGSASLAVSVNGDIYIGNTDTGVIQIFRDGELRYFAGIEGERAFIDGVSPRFYSPQRLEHHGGYLYIWDFNTLRRLEASRGVAGECITLAGMASPHFDMAPDMRRKAAEDVILPFGSLMDFAVTDDGILVTDPKRGVIWVIEG